MSFRVALAVLATALVLDAVGAYKQLHLCNGSGRRYCANSQRALRCPETCRPDNCVPRPMGAEGSFYTRCYQIRPPICETIFWEDVAATNVYDYVYLNTTMDQAQAQVCMSTCREEPFRGICLATEKGVNGVDYCKQMDCRRLKMPNQSGCHQPRDFHAPTCFECERLFPLACGGDGGGVLKGWKAQRIALDRELQLENDKKYNASVAKYAEVMDSSFDDVFRWLNGASAPRIPAWYKCAKMNNDRLVFLQELLEQDKLQKEREAWQSQRVTTLPQSVIEALANGTYSATDFPNTFGAFNEDVFTADDDDESDSAGDLVSSEGLPFAAEWAELKCKNFFEDAFRAVDSGDSDDDDDDDNSADLDELEVEGSLDWLPPWQWQPWNKNWKPLPEGMQWYWEIIEAMELEIQSTDPATVHAAVVAGMDALVGAAGNGNMAGILESSTIIAISGEASEVTAQAADAAVQPKVVNIIFQVSDTTDAPFPEDEDALKAAIASIPSVPVGNVSIMDVFQDVTQQIVTISASIQADNPLEASVQFAKAERSGELAAILAEAGFAYLEVSMTYAVAFAPEGLYWEPVEFLAGDGVTAELQGHDGDVEEDKDMTVAVVAGCAAAAVAVAGVIVAVAIVRKRRSAAAETSKAPEKPAMNTDAAAESKAIAPASVQEVQLEGDADQQ